MAPEKESRLENSLVRLGTRTGKALAKGLVMALLVAIVAFLIPLTCGLTAYTMSAMWYRQIDTVFRAFGFAGTVDSVFMFNVGITLGVLVSLISMAAYFGIEIYRHLFAEE